MFFEQRVKWAFILVACLSLSDVKNSLCWGLCRQEGFDTGTFELKTDSCVCGVKRKFRDITDKQIRVIPKHKTERDEDFDEVR